MNDTQLSAHFTLKEMCATQTGIPNEPTPKVVENLRYLCLKLLEPIRQACDLPIRVNSGYRSMDVNRAVGGATCSQHLTGLAADITLGSPNMNKMLAALIQAMRLPYDQLINENDYSWLHISIRLPHQGENRRQFLTLKPKKK